MDRDPERHSLTADALKNIYDKRVSPRLFRGATTVQTPTAIILGGQPGSGKTPLQAAAAREFADKGGIVKIIGDDLRAYLPHYKSLQRADDRTAGFYTDRDSGRLVEMAIAEAARRRVNVLVEGTMRDPETVVRTLREFREAGFRTEARVVAVNPELSRLGILQRYASQKESRGVGRMTTNQAHDDAVRGVPLTLDRIQNERLADTLTIYRRGGEVIRSIDLSGVERPGAPSARAIVEREHKRALTTQEAQYTSRELSRIAADLNRMGAVKDRDASRPNIPRQNMDAPSTERDGVRDQSRKR